MESLCVTKVSTGLSEVRVIFQDSVTLVMKNGSILMGKSTLQVTILAVYTTSYCFASSLIHGFYLALSTFKRLLCDMP